MDQHRAPISYTPEPCSDSREEVQNLQAKCLRIQAERDRFKNALWALRAEFIALQAKAEGLELERDELKDTLGAKQRSQSSFTVNGYTSRSAPAAGNGESSNSHVSATMEQPMRLPSTLAAAQIMPYEAYAQIGGWAGHPSNNVASASNGSANPSKSSTQSTVLKPSPLPSPATHAPRHTLVPVTKGRKAKAPAKPAPASKTAEKRPVPYETARNDACLESSPVRFCFAE
ncbi:hypothetical protein FA15DRAFT_57051 [Coprinopsis marcescibilis]|uniref:Uncharacterized protein n=1 Tax=Coprinopsis marcescibilis TaxID=230819 RepID=A0A5C3KNK8_COPMA|nr:hypothetical protein FA15DRAFT_57051 [Coprinopsis marcescibilis]